MASKILDYMNIAPENRPKDGYTLGRDIVASARLNLQHFLMKETVGYLLHPQIPVKPDMKIADVATGTGIWILDASRSLPPTVSFEGFDISSAQFPPSEILPANIKFSTFDASAEIPAALVGKFDVVRVSMLVAIVDVNPDPWIRNLCRMLKPGGYLQWMEGDAYGFAQWMHEQPIDAARFPALAEFESEQVARRDDMLALCRWTAELGEHFDRCGLQHVTYQAPKRDAVLLKAYTENAVLTHAEMLRGSGGGHAAEARIDGFFADVAGGAIFPGVAPVVAMGMKPVHEEISQEAKSIS